MSVISVTTAILLALMEAGLIKEKQKKRGNNMMGTACCYFSGYQIFL